MAEQYKITSKGGITWDLAASPDGGYIATGDDGLKYKLEAPGPVGSGALETLATEFSNWLDTNHAKPSWGEDVANKAKSGLVEWPARAVGQFGDLEGWARDRAGDLNRATGGPDDPNFTVKGSAPNNKFVPGTNDILGDINKVTGFEPYVARTPAGRVLDSIGGGAAGAAVFGMGGAVPRAGVAGAAPRAVSTIGNTVRSAVEQGAVPGAAGGLAYEAFQNSPYQTPAALIANMAAGTYGRNAVTPNPTRPLGRDAQVQTLERAGVTALTAGQRSGNTELMLKESSTGGNRFHEIVEAQNRQFTAAVLRRAGVMGIDQLTQPLLNTLERRVGTEMDRLANAYGGDLDLPDARRVMDAFDHFVSHIDMPTPPVIERRMMNFVDEITDAVANGRPVHFDGETYQNIRSSLGDSIKTFEKAGNHNAAEAFRELQGVFDDAVANTITNTNPDDLGAWTAARTNYQSLKIIERAYGAKDAATRAGFITPGQLHSAIEAVQGKSHFALGWSQYSDLADAGEAILRMPTNTSNTAGALSAKNAGMRLGPVVLGGAAGNLASGGDLGATGSGAAWGVAGAMALPWMINRARMSPIGQGYLGNQILNLPPRSWADNAANVSTLGNTLNPQQGLNPPPFSLRNPR